MTEILKTAFIVIILPVILLSGCYLPEVPEDDTETVAPPVLNPEPGPFSGDTEVSLTCTTGGAVIYYTLDGTDPTSASKRYKKPIPVSGDDKDVTIRAIAVKDGMDDSDVTVGQYIISYPQVSGPVFAPGESKLTEDSEITIECETPGAEIHYTTDRSVPSVSSPLYTAPLSIEGDGTVMTIKAVAVKNGMKASEISGKKYTIAYPAQASLSIDKETITIDSNESAIIIATAKKSDATDDSISAISMDASVATVSVDGLNVKVTGVKAGSSTIAVISGSGISKTCSLTSNASWHTIFRDDFDAEVLDQAYHLNGNKSHFSLDSGKLKVKWLAETGNDNPVFVYNPKIGESYYRVSMDVTTGPSITGTPQFGFQLNMDAAVAAESYYSVRIEGSKLLIKKYFNKKAADLKSENLDSPLEIDKTYKIECTYNDGHIKIYFMDSSGTVLKSLIYTDLLPLDNGYAAFWGNVKNDEKEYLLINNFTISRYE